MASKITFEVVDQPQIGDEIILSLDHNGEEVRSNFVSNRMGSGQISIGATKAETAQNIVDSFAMDFYFINTSGNFIYSFDGQNIVFEVFGQQNIFDNAIIPVDPNPIIENYVEDNYLITLFEFEQHFTDPCEYYRLHVKTSKTTGNIKIGNWNPIFHIINSNEFFVDLPRSSNILNITFYDLNGVEIVKNFFQPQTWTASASVHQTSSGATLVLTPQLSGDENVSLGFTYSLDGENFMQNAAWTGLEGGDYTGYIKDAFGCSKEVEVNVAPTNEVVDPYIFVSMLNSIRYARRNDGRRNFENLESYEDQNEINYRDFYHRFRKNEMTVTQFRSSYLSNRAYLLQNSKILFEIPLLKLTENINRNDFRDGHTFSANGGKLGVYYDGGNIYNGETGEITGESTLYGTLLEPQNAGFFVEIEGYGWLPILSVEIDPNHGYYMLFDVPHIGNPGGYTQKIRTIYTVENYEIYEFGVNWENEGCYQIAIVSGNAELTIGGDPLDGIKYLSEPILIDGEYDFDDYHFIKWKNSINNQLLWETGIEGFAYLRKITEPTFEAKGESDIYMTDESAHVLESEMLEVFTFHFELLPLAIARQVAFLSTCDFLEIDGIKYVKEENIEIEPQIGSNLYQVKLKLTKANAFNSNSESGNNVASQNGYLEIGTNGYLGL